MSEEEIRERIIVCQECLQNWLEVGKQKNADRYSKEIYKWEKLLESINPKMLTELNEYKRLLIN